MLGIVEEICSDSPDELILEKCKLPLDMDRDYMGMTLLHWSASVGRLSLLDSLLDIQTDQRALTNGRGQTYMHLLVQRPISEIAHILRKDIDRSMQGDRHGQTFWDHWARSAPIAALAQAAQEFQGYLPKQVISDRFLEAQGYFWSNNSDFDILALYKSFGRNLEVRALDLKTPLMAHGYSKSAPEFANELSHAITPVGHRDSEGRTLAMIIVREDVSDPSEKLSILIEKDKDLKVFDYHLNSIVQATLQGNRSSEEKIQIISFLKDHMPSEEFRKAIRSNNANGKGAINDAIENGDLKLIELVTNMLMETGGYTKFKEYQAYKSSNEDISDNYSELFKIKKYFKGKPKEFKHRALFGKQMAKLEDPLETALKVGSTEIFNFIMAKGATLDFYTSSNIRFILLCLKNPGMLDLSEFNDYFLDKEFVMIEKFVTKAYVYGKILEELAKSEDSFKKVCEYMKQKNLVERFIHDIPRSTAISSTDWVQPLIQIMIKNGQIESLQFLL